MTSADLATTNAWLAVIAIASLVQSLVIIGLVVAVFRLVRRTESAVEEVKREYLEPIATRTNKVIGEVEDALARFRSMDDRVSGAINTTSEGLSAVAGMAKRRFWPVVGVVRGLRAIAGAIADRKRQSGALTQLDQDAQQRFSYEGGTSHARTYNAR
ncbi:MAG TPA: hypothetical protein VMS54_00105 [Vicinamibacterales bacterium]|nr:hypothetical protein [Vicinamibacterales bacterium]